MPKFTIVGEFERDTLARVVPPEYRQLASALASDGVRYMVIKFAHDRRDVVTSATVDRALVEIPKEARVLAIGGNFTREALNLLERRNAIVARLGEFYWTDESFHSLSR